MTDETMPAVVLLRAGPEIDAPLGRLTALLASAIGTLFGDPTLVLHLVSPGGARAEQRIGGTRHEWLAATPGVRDVRDACDESTVRAALER